MVWFRIFGWVVLSEWFEERTPNPNPLASAAIQLLLEGVTKHDQDVEM